MQWLISNGASKKKMQSHQTLSSQVMRISSKFSVLYSKSCMTIVTCEDVGVIMYFALVLFMQAKRFISELSRIADHTSSSTFTVQQLRDVVKVYTSI